jgi:hypothetical protein
MKEVRQRWFGFGSMGGYYTYDEVVAELDTMRIFIQILLLKNILRHLN